MDNKKTIEVNNQFMKENFGMDSTPCNRGDLEVLYGRIEELMPKIEDIEPAELELGEFIPSKKRNYVYLAGNISSNPKTYEWRDEFISYVDNEPKIVVVNPCANKFNQSMKNASQKGIEFIKEAVKRSQKILRAKDYQMVKMCNVIVVHLGLSNEKPMIGTIQELTWARDIFNIPVIAICDEENPYTTHPWIDECCSAKVESVAEAANMLKTFFVEY